MASLKHKDLNEKDLLEMSSKLERGNLAKLQEIKQANIKENAELEKSLAKKGAADLATAERKTRKDKEKAELELQKKIQKMNLEEFMNYKASIGEEVDKATARVEKLKNDVSSSAKDSLKKNFGVKGGEVTSDFWIRQAEQLAKALMNGVGKAIDGAIDIYTKYQTGISTRLLGTNKDFSTVTESALKSSPLYKTSSYIENVNKLVESGIAQNVEQRAFLETIKDELVTTFDTTNSTLERLVRIQNQDSTAARMGMEAYLNEFLNFNFQNTEYLTDKFDSVSASIEEATALMTAQASTAAEYAIQKWLGSLYSVGMSGSGIDTIANALGQLGSGNINNLVGTNAGNLLAMVTNGKFADYLKNGLSATAVNDIMSDLVSYLTTLNGSGNNVVRSQLANIFGMSISDLQAASNLNTNAIIDSTLSYSDATKKLASLMGTANERVSMATKMQNFMDNLSFAFGRNIADSQALTAVWTGSKMADELGIDVVSGLANIAKMGVMGVGAYDLVKSMINGETSLLGSLTKVYNALGSSATLSGSGLSGSGRSQSGKLTSGNLSSSASAFSSSTEAQEVKAMEQSTLSDDDIEIVVPNIYKYLTETLDNKFDTLIKLQAISSNYSVVDSIGNNLTNTMATIMGGNSVIVKANEQATKSAELIDTITENVTSINDILKKVTTGELQFTVRDTGSVQSMAGGALISAAYGLYGSVTG